MTYAELIHVNWLIVGIIALTLGGLWREGGELFHHLIGR